MGEHHKKSVAEIALSKGEQAARKAILQDLFYDFNRSRGQVYWFNFWRGVFFGFGTVIGGTVIVGLVIWALSGFEHSIPFLQQFVSSLKQK